MHVLTRIGAFARLGSELPPGTLWVRSDFCVTVII
jgi:hypothetical protein